MEGRGKLTLTGKLGDVMQESAQAAMSYRAQPRARCSGLPRDFYRHLDIHLHVPEGAIPKDGPSAGITIATSIISALTSIPVRADVAMTGEITVRGRVLPIGGLKEKLLAAHRHGIREAILPEDNEKDLPDIPENIRKEMKLHFVDVDGRSAEAGAGTRNGDGADYRHADRRRRSWRGRAAKRIDRTRTGGAVDAFTSRRVCRLDGAVHGGAVYNKCSQAGAVSAGERDPEIAFLGRSNVGKSSLLNALVGAEGLAFTSSRPGCTQSINFYPGRREVTVSSICPGMDSQKFPKQITSEWKELIESYLLGRERSAAGGDLLLDARRGWMERDLELRDWLGVPWAAVRGGRHES